MKQRPALFLSSRLSCEFDGFRDPGFLRTQCVAMIAVAHFQGQNDAQPLLKINRRGQRDGLAGIIGREGGDGIGIRELLEGGLCERVVAADPVVSKERRAFLNRVGAGFLRGPGRARRFRLGEKLEQPVAVLFIRGPRWLRGRGLGRIDLLFKLLRRGAGRHDLRHLGRFFLGVVNVQKGRRVAEVLVRLLVLRLEDFEDAEVALDAFDSGLREQINDARLMSLAVAIDAAIALLENHERPRQIEMDQPVAEVVEIEPLGRHIRTEHHSDGVILAPEAID